MAIALAALAVNVCLKILLFRQLGAVGLATATSIGLWVNFGALMALATARGFVDLDDVFAKTLAASVVAGALLALVALFGRGPALAFGRHFGGQANLVALLSLGVGGALVYGAALIGVLYLSGMRLSTLRGRPAKAS